MEILKSLFIRNSVAPGDEEGREPKTWKEIIALMLFNFICQKSISIQNFINPDNWFGKCGEGIDVSNQEREIDICGRQCERRQRCPFLLWRYSAVTEVTIAFPDIFEENANMCIIFNIIISTDGI